VLQCRNCVPAYGVKSIRTQNSSRGWSIGPGKIKDDTRNRCSSSDSYRQTMRSPRPGAATVAASARRKVALRLCLLRPPCIENSKFYELFGYGMTNTGQDAWLMTCSVIVPVTKSLILSLPSVQMTIKSIPSFSAVSKMIVSGLPSRNT